MDFKNTNYQSQSCLTYSKGIKVLIILAATALSTLTGCSSKKSKSNTPDLVYFDSLEGEVHLLSTVGENSEVYFSPALNKLLFVRNNPAEHKTPQIYEKNLVDKTEKRLTYNIGENHNPQYHPTKAWVLYSSSADELVEKVNVIPTMRELGLNVPEAKATADVPQDIYITSDRGSDFKRITHERGFDGLAVFSKDGEKVYYVRRESTPKGPESSIIVFDLKNGSKKTYLTEKSKIMSLSVSQELIAWTSKSGDDNEKLTIKKIKGNDIVFQGNPKFSFSDVELHPKEMRLLVISNIEDQKNKDVYQIDLGEKCATRFSFHGADESHPTFGPEGVSLFYVSNRSKTNQIYSTLIRPSLPCKPLE